MQLILYNTITRTIILVFAKNCKSLEYLIFLQQCVVKDI